MSGKSIEPEIISCNTFSMVFEAVFVSRVADLISGSSDGNGSAVAVEAVCGSVG